jgi:hypothetical protein
MIFVQPLYYNILTTFSLILTLYSYFLSSFSLSLSLYCFGPMRREKMKVVIKVVPNGCTYITTRISNMFQIIMSAKHGNPQTSTITLNIVIVTYTEEKYLNY